MTGPIVVRFGISIPKSARFFDVAEGRIFLNLLDNEAIEPGDFAIAEANGKFGVDLRKCLPFEAGFKKVDDLSRLVELVEIEPFKVRGFYAWTGEALDTELKSPYRNGDEYRYGKYVETEAGLVLVVSKEAITADESFEAKSAQRNVLVVARSEYEPDDDHKVEGLAGFIAEILSQHPQKLVGTLVPKSVPKLVCMIGFSVGYPARGQFSYKEEVDGIEEGTLSTIFVNTTEGKPFAEGSVVEIIHRGKNVFEAMSTDKKPRLYANTMEDVIDALSIDRRKFPSRRPELRSNGQIRVRS